MAATWCYAADPAGRVEESVAAMLSLVGAYVCVLLTLSLISVIISTT